MELIGLRKLPATKNFVDQTAPALERNVINRVESEHLTDVVVRVPAETFCVEEVGQEVFLKRSAVLRVGKGVCDTEAEITAVSVVHVDLQALIERRVSLIDLGDRGITKIGPVRIDSISSELLGRTWRRLV